MFVQYQGQANALCERILYALTFFNLENKYELYLNGRVRGIRKKNDGVTCENDYNNNM